MLTLEQARTYAALEVERMGEDFLYNTPGSNSTCLYVPTTDPRAPWTKNDRENELAVGATRTGCLVGSIITRAGLMTDEIAETNLSIGGLIHGGSLVVENDGVTRYLKLLQSAQDAGSTWGEAHKTAESSIR